MIPEAIRRILDDNERSKQFVLQLAKAQASQSESTTINVGNERIKVTPLRKLIEQK